jgi:hypothetical protein
MLGFALMCIRIEMTTYGYARVSTDGQTLDTQRAKLTAAGAETIFSEKESGAKTDRKALAKALATLQEGDVLVVTRWIGWPDRPWTFSTRWTP